ncbi:hypothetical protein ACIQTT_00835 [Microbacterium sp. NPDC090225]|uniref:hypothetical protein n=1 Tax=Microbacterium sp. NPDC090225 TaxID=3364207 RepID=UPI0037F538E8
MSTPDSSAPNDSRSYDGPDADIAAGDITDADFAPAVPDSGSGSGSGDEPESGSDTGA